MKLIKYISGGLLVMTSVHGYAGTAALSYDISNFFEAGTYSLQIKCEGTDAAPNDWKTLYTFGDQTAFTTNSNQKDTLGISGHKCILRKHNYMGGNDINIAELNVQYAGGSSIAGHTHTISNLTCTPRNTSLKHSCSINENLLSVRGVVLSKPL